MCGIVGKVGFSDHESRLNALKILSHRGPDNLNYFANDDVFLGHTRLSILDLSDASNQPFWDEHNLACIVFNGEIYNFKKLRAELEADGIVFRSHGDAEVLLNLYLVHGESCLEKLSKSFHLLYGTLARISYL